MTTLSTLSEHSDLYQLAESCFHTGAPRKRLFTIPSFTKAFYSLSEAQQESIWKGLMQDRRGKPVPLVPDEVLDTWFDKLCQYPNTFDWDACTSSDETSCPEPWLRKQLAYRLNEVLLGRRAPRYKLWHQGGYEPNVQGLRVHSRRTGEFSDQWVYAVRSRLYGRLLRDEFMEWTEDPRLERVLAHEKAAMNGSMPYTKTFRKHVVHPISLDIHESFGAPATVNKRRQRAFKRELEADIIAKAQAQDRSQNQLVYAETDAALINLGGGVKDLGRAMKERANADKMPSLNEVWSRITLGPAFELISDDRWPALEEEYRSYLRT